VRVISPKTLRQFWERHRAAEMPLRAWLKIAEQTNWASIQHVRQTYPHADAVPVSSGRTTTVFNIGDGKFRLITAIHYNTRRIFVLRVLTHREYDRAAWKEQL